MDFLTYRVTPEECDATLDSFNIQFVGASQLSTSQNDRIFTVQSNSPQSMGAYTFEAQATINLVQLDLPFIVQVIDLTLEPISDVEIAKGESDPYVIDLDEHFQLSLDSAAAPFIEVTSSSSSSGIDIQLEG